MSNVRMCDKCGTIFSERANGWTTMVGTRIGRDAKGRPNTVTEQMDTCPMCSSGDAIEPRLAIQGSADRVADTLPVVDAA